MQICGREFSGKTISQIEEMVRTNPTLSRRAVSLRVCEKLQWRSINGRLKEVSCRKALLELNRRGLITLPAAEKTCFKRSRRRSFMDHSVDVAEVKCTLRELGEIRVVAVSSRYSKMSQV